MARFLGLWSLQPTGPDFDTVNEWRTGISPFHLCDIGLAGFHARHGQFPCTAIKLDDKGKDGHGVILVAFQMVVRGRMALQLVALGNVGFLVSRHWDRLEKFQAYRNSAAFKDLLPIREKIAKFRTFIVEGVPQ